MNEIIYEKLFGNKTVEEVQADLSKQLRELTNPNTVNYYEIEKGNGWFTMKHVYIPAGNGKGKFHYAKWVKYIGNATWIPKGSKMSYEEWIKDRNKKMMYSMLGSLFFISLVVMCLNMLVNKIQ